MSLSRRGKPQQGGVRKHSEEAKHKMSECRKGRKLSDEDKLKKSLAQRGKPKSEEHKQALKKPKAKINCSKCGKLFGTNVLQRHLQACVGYE